MQNGTSRFQPALGIRLATKTEQCCLVQNKGEFLFFLHHSRTRCILLCSSPSSSPRARSLSLGIWSLVKSLPKPAEGIVLRRLARRLDTSLRRRPARRRAQVRPRQRLWSEPPLPSLRLPLDPLPPSPSLRVLLPLRRRLRLSDRSKSFRSTRTTKFERCTALYPSPGILLSVSLSKPNLSSN